MVDQIILIKCSSLKGKLIPSRRLKNNEARVDLILYWYDLSLYVLGHTFKQLCYVDLLTYLPYLQ